jgi:hypothetical protein
MKYIKGFNEEITETSIVELCKILNIIDYEVIGNGIVNVNGDVDISGIGLTKIPIQFGKVGGLFTCSNNKLSSLKGAPSEVGENFFCSSNRLTTLKGSPKIVKGYFNCFINYLSTLKGAPNKVGGDFSCWNNNLVLLEYCPKIVDGSFECTNNKIITLEWIPERVGGHFACNYNPVWQLYILFNSFDEYKASLDYKYWRGLDINKRRFEAACEDAGIKMPESIPGYEFI